MVPIVFLDCAAVSRHAEGSEVTVFFTRNFVGMVLV
jgi:hypothetical protein